MIPIGEGQGGEDSAENTRLWTTKRKEVEVPVFWDLLWVFRVSLVDCKVPQNMQERELMGFKLPYFYKRVISWLN